VRDFSSIVSHTTSHSRTLLTNSLKEKELDIFGSWCDPPEGLLAQVIHHTPADREAKRHMAEVRRKPGRRQVAAAWWVQAEDRQAGRQAGGHEDKQVGKHEAGSLLCVASSQQKTAQTGEATKKAALLRKQEGRKAESAGESSAGGKASAQG
jgi:hypothetical protein